MMKFQTKLMRIAVTVGKPRIGATMIRYYVVENRNDEIVYLGNGYDSYAEAEKLYYLERQARMNAGIHADLWTREEVEE